MLRNHSLSSKSYIVSLENTYGVFLNLMLLLRTQRNAARRLEEEITNVGAPPHGHQVPPLKQGANMEQAPVNPPPLKDENIRTTLLQMDQIIPLKHKRPRIKPKL